MTVDCPHLTEVVPVAPEARDVCPQCVAAGDSWVHLRACLECGHVGCCDSSPNTHATRHFRTSGHALVRSLEPGEHWGWCYVDELLVPGREMPPEVS
ncbi:CPA2 family monovalent cation:H+ antiporter-2 [Isoptericola jiangsuensis]|uniref:CPA2 family monovalent cation:H+ antiporter-2 n=1 Tax=Isoptericola jiangsuensis TaxID=548579 RepID=A0A2A9ETG3_9MICO|nr:UBP-type zinc finger domain-containing protein [Isoptericola jiangsuensis]PFG41570.1 CPA2 family monovalent cation:H+ antiporter-2 [Isoptericola jiangsuensis]